MSRAIWKGRLLLGKQQVPVKMYSAIEDRKIRFQLLHAKDHAPVEQHIVRKDDGEEVPKESQRKAYPLSRDIAVILEPEELEQLEPAASRDIELCRFVPKTVLSDQWYDRPYALGPDGDEESYFALVSALERQGVIGIARWVMRKKQYVGALGLADGYLTMATLRRAEQVLSFSGIEPAKAAAPQVSELKLAEQLVASITGDFEPQLWENEYRKRVLELIAAKSRSEHLEPIKPKRRAEQGSLADALKASISAARQKKAA